MAKIEPRMTAIEGTDFYCRACCAMWSMKSNVDYEFKYVMFCPCCDSSTNWTRMSIGKWNKWHPYEKRIEG